MDLIDTHCHIHDADFPLPIDEVLTVARAAGVGQMLTVGTDVDNSRRAVDFARKNDGVLATIGIHPGEPQNGTPDDLEHMILEKSDKLVGFGDIGLDYHRQQSLQAPSLLQARSLQRELLEAQLDLAVKHNLPVSFHVREAFDDFWPIFDNFSGLRGTLHSFTDGVGNLEKALSRGLYISVNGIVTFNREPGLDEVYRTVPLDRVILETDAPFLAPKPHRGQANQPAYVADIARFFADSRGISLDEMAEITTKNAKILFNMV